MTPLESCEHVFHHGHLQPAALAGLRLDDHALHFGTAAFEALRILPTPLGPRILAWSLHEQRLNHSLRTLGLALIPADQLATAIHEFATANEVTDGYLRILAYPDGDCTRFDPSSYPTTFSILGWHTDHRATLPPLRLDVATLRQPNSDDQAARAKLSGSYARAAISHARARKAGFDDTIKLHGDGTVCEATGANLFAVRGGKLFTPELPDSIHGTTRRLVLALAKQAGIETFVAPLPLNDLLTADEAFLTGTYFGISPIGAVTEHAMAIPAPGPTTDHLRAEFFAWIEDPEQEAARGWLEPIASATPTATSLAAPSFASADAPNAKLSDASAATSSATLSNASTAAPAAAPRHSIPQHSIRPASPGDLDAVLFGVRSLLAELTASDELELPAGARATCTRWLESGETGLAFIAERNPSDEAAAADTPDASAGTQIPTDDPGPTDRQDPIGVLTLSLAEAIHAGGTVATIQELWVHPDHRSLGVGEALIAAAVRAAKEHDARQLEVGLPRYRFDALALTQAFYANRGFEIIGPRMRLTLGEPGQ